MNERIMTREELETEARERLIELEEYRREQAMIAEHERRVRNAAMLRETQERLYRPGRMF